MTRPRKHELLEYVRRKNPVPNFLDSSQEFILDAPVPLDDRNELYEQGRLLHERGLLRLPYDQTLIQTPIGDNACMLAHCFYENIDQWHDGQWFKKGIRHLVWGYDPVKGWHKGAHESYIFAVENQSIDLFIRSADEARFSRDISDIDLIGLIETIAALVLLRTKGVRRERLMPSEKLNKARLKRRQIPIDTATVIRIQEHFKTETTRGPAGERHRPRLHTRRGHIRLQPYGPRLSKVREIWIDPCIVGYEEEGIITHDHYEIDEQRHLKESRP